jgi:hypothetical protein
VDQPAHPRIVFRSRFGIGLTIVVWAICAAGIVSALLVGAGIAPVVLLASLGWFVWLAFWRPSVVTDAHGVELRNLVRDVEVPYAAIDDVDTRYSLVVHSGGKSFSAWGAPAPGGAASLRDSMSRRRSTNRTDWKDAPRSVRAGGAARPGDTVDSASGAPATVIRRELERREHEGVRRDPTGRAVVTVRPALIALSIVAITASIAVIVIPGV